MPVLHAHLWYLLLGVWHTKVGNRVLTLFEERRAAVLFCLHFGAKKCNKNALAHAIMHRILSDVIRQIFYAARFCFLLGHYRV